SQQPVKTNRTIISHSGLRYPKSRLIHPYRPIFSRSKYLTVPQFQYTFSRALPLCSHVIVGYHPETCRAVENPLAAFEVRAHRFGGTVACAQRVCDGEHIIEPRSMPFERHIKDRASVDPIFLQHLLPSPFVEM